MSSDSNINNTASNPFSLLKEWDFSALFLGGFVSNIGSYFTVVALVFLALDFTSHLPDNIAVQEVALISTFSLLPMILLGPIGGAIADRLDRKKVLYIADFLGAIAAFSLIFSTKIWHLYIFSIVNASVRQFFYPAKQASLPKIVNRERLLSANGLIQSTQQLSRIIGPLVAGFVTAAFGLRIAFIVDGFTYLFSAAMIMSIKTDLHPEKGNGKVSLRNVAHDMKEGFSLVMHDKILRFILAVFFFTILCIGFIDPLIVPYLDIEFGMGEKEFGILMSISAVSGIFAAIIISIKKQMKRKIAFMLSTIVVLAVMTFIIGIAAYLPGGVIWLFIGFASIGVVNVGFNVPFSTLLQKIVLNKHLGKISGIIDTVLNIAMFLASLIAVILSRYLPISLIFIIISSIIAAAGIIGLVLNRANGYDHIANERELEMKQYLEQEQGRENTIKKDKSIVDKHVEDSELRLEPAI